MIVGLYSSVPRSGKSTVAQLLSSEFGFVRLSLAAPVKECLYPALSNVKEAHEYIWGDKKGEVIPGVGVTGGYLMSTFATDYMRNMINEDLWLNLLLSKARKYTKKGAVVVVDDMRFSNEFDAFDYRVKVVRPDVQTNHGRSNLSEGQLDKLFFDNVIYNASTLETLRAICNQVGAEIKELNDRHNHKGEAPAMA